MGHVIFNPGFRSQIPSKTYSWNQMSAGDCVLAAGSSVTVYADGNVQFTGVVWTNHTSSGDIWHHTITFQDYRGITLFSLRFEGPGRMYANGAHWNFGPVWQRYNAQFFNAIARATATGAC